MGDIVSVQENNVGFERIDAFDDSLEKERLRILVKVDVAELGNAETMEARGQVIDVNGAVYDIQFMTTDLAGVQHHAGSGDSRSNNEVTPSEGQLSSSSAVGRSFSEPFLLRNATHILFDVF